jgi:hypothetical protein
MVLASQNKLYKIYTTRHDVVAQSDKGYKWIYINNESLTGGPQKLRWNSIKAVKLIDNLVFIHTSCTIHVNQVFVADIENNVVYRLKLDIDENFIYNSDECFNIEIESVKFIIHSKISYDCPLYGKTTDRMEIDLSEIKKEINRLR